jgi:hypothetical protein
MPFEGRDRLSRPGWSAPLVRPPATDAAPQRSARRTSGTRPRGTIACFLGTSTAPVRRPPGSRCLARRHGDHPGKTRRDIRLPSAMPPTRSAVRSAQAGGELASQTRPETRACRSWERRWTNHHPWPGRPDPPAGRRAAALGPSRPRTPPSNECAVPSARRSALACRVWRLVASRTRAPTREPAALARRRPRAGRRQGGGRAHGRSGADRRAQARGLSHRRRSWTRGDRSTFALSSVAARIRCSEGDACSWRECPKRTARLRTC